MTDPEIIVTSVGNIIPFGLGGIYSCKTDLTSAQIKTLNTPIQIVGAIGEGRIIIPAMYALTYFGGGKTPYDASAVNGLQFTFDGNATQIAVFSKNIFTATDNSSVNAIATNLGQFINDDYANKGIMLSTDAGEFTDGTGTARISIFYYVLNVL